MTPQTPSGQQAVERIRRYVEMRDANPLIGLSDVVHAIHGPPPGGAELLLSDLRALVSTAALATPPAQEVEEETETLENLIDAAIGARTAPPWQEQAAQIRRDALEEAAKVCDLRAKTAVSHMEATDVPSYKEAFARDAEEAEDCADDIRALLSKPAQEGVSRKRDGGSPRSIKHPPYAPPGEVA